VIDMMRETLPENGENFRIFCKDTNFLRSQPRTAGYSRNAARPEPGIRVGLPDPCDGISKEEEG